MQQTISQYIWNMKYRNGEETVEDFFKRQADALGIDGIYEQLASQKLCLGGRCQYALGTNYQGQTLSNCFVVKIENDSMQAIMKAQEEFVMTMKAGGGVGCNFSVLRPAGTTIKTTAATSSGVVSFLEGFDAWCSTIKAGNSRRGAMMAVLDIWHPEIIGFIKAKSEKGKLNNFNISIAITHKFMEAVEKDEEWDLVFPDITDEDYDLWDGDLDKWLSMGKTTIVYDTVKAKELFDLIMKSNYDFAEPGVLFIDTINENNNVSYYGTICATNPCFTGDMKLLTSDGYKSFSELNQVKDFCIINADGERSIGRVWINGEKEVIKLKLSDKTEIKCTPDHIFKTADGEEKEARLLLGQRLLKPYVIKNNFSFEAFSAGFIVGDGNLTRLGSQRHKGLEINIGIKDKEVAQFLGMQLAEGERKYYSNYLYDVAQKWGLNGVVLPERDLPELTKIEELSDFLSGLYSANGSVIREGRVSYKTTSKLMANQIANYLEILGIECYITTNLSKKVKWDNGDYCSKESYDVNISRLSSLIKFAEKISFIHKYKRDALSKVLKDKMPKVMKIENAGVERVYDFYEPKTHWGVVEGFVVHNCGEQPLLPYESCNLGAINLTKFVVNPFTDDACIDEDALKETIRYGVRALNKVLDINSFPLKKYKDTTQKLRPIGLGIMGFGSMLNMLGIMYDSDSGVNMANSLGRIIANEAYKESAKMAKEEGAFLSFDREKFLQSNFVQKLDKDVRDMIAEYGIRNSRLLTIAPTGTTAILANNVSGGLEPLYSLEYTREIKQPDGTTKKEKVMDYSWYLYCEQYKHKRHIPIPNYFNSTATEITPKAHIDIQSTWQYWIDASVSKTINVPENISFDDFKDIYQYAYKMNLKGCTTYRPNDILGSVLYLDQEPKQKGSENKEHKRYIDDGNLNELYEIELEDDEPAIRHIARWKNKSKVYIIITITEDGYPLEIFTKLPKDAGDGLHQFERDQFFEYVSNWDAICRTASTLLRIGMPIPEITKQLDKSAYGMFDCSAILARKLKTYPRNVTFMIHNKEDDDCEENYEIDDMVESTNETVLINKTDTCPECNANLIEQEGCKLCMSCGYSRCS